MSSQASLKRKSETSMDEANHSQDFLFGLSSFSEMSLEGIEINEDIDIEKAVIYESSTEKSKKLATNESSSEILANNMLYDIKSKSNSDKGNGQFYFTLLRVELEHFVEEPSSISEMASKIIATHKGSIYLQGLLNDLPKESIYLLFLAIEQEFLDFLTKPYSNYFCQQLFFFLEMPERIKLIKDLIPKILELVKGSKGKCSIIFILENLQTEQEKQLVIKLLDPVIFTYIWEPKFMRIGESLIGTYKRASIQFLLDFIISNLTDFVKVREGYYLLRTVVKHLKTPEEQMKIITVINENFLEIAKNFNGSLLLQCIIHNFPIPTYNYTKSSISCVNNNGLAPKVNKEGMNDNNKALEILYSTFIQHSDEWDNNKLKAVVECAIKFGSNQFGKLYLNNLSKHAQSFMRSVYSIKIMKIMIKSFENSITISILKVISQHIKHLDTNKQEKWNKLYDQFFDVSKLKPALFSNSSLSTLESNGSSKEIHIPQSQFIKNDSKAFSNNNFNGKHPNHGPGVANFVPTQPQQNSYISSQMPGPSNYYFVYNNYIPEQIYQQMPMCLVNASPIYQLPPQLGYLDHNKYINMGYREPSSNVNQYSRNTGFYYN